jgi:hypothetical protein
MNRIPGLTEAIHGNEEEKSRHEEIREEEVGEEARSGSFARHPPAAVAAGSVLPAFVRAAPPQSNTQQL